MRLRVATAVLAIAVGAAASAPAAGAATVRHKTQTAAGGNVTATLSYDERTHFDLPQDSRLRLSITRGGTGAFSGAPGTASGPCGHGDVQCTVSSGALTVRDIEGNGEPDVILDLYTGGAHCCSVLQVYAWDPATMTYTVTGHDFGDPGARITDLAGDGHLEFESADDRFAYEFGAFAFSGLPMQIWRFSGHRFVDVTRQFPAAVTADARSQYNSFLSGAKQSAGLGFLAAWAADEDLLGQQALVSRTLAAQLRAGRLRSIDGHIWPGGRRFIARLQRFLRHTGYSA